MGDDGDAGERLVAVDVVEMGVGVDHQRDVRPAERALRRRPQGRPQGRQLTGIDDHQAPGRRQHDGVGERLPAHLEDGGPVAQADHPDIRVGGAGRVCGLSPHGCGDAERETKDKAGSSHCTSPPIQINPVRRRLHFRLHRITAGQGLTGVRTAGFGCAGNSLTGMPGSNRKMSR